MASRFILVFINGFVFCYSICLKKVLNTENAVQIKMRVLFRFWEYCFYRICKSKLLQNKKYLDLSNKYNEKADTHKKDLVVWTHVIISVLLFFGQRFTGITI